MPARAARKPPPPDPRRPPPRPPRVGDPGNGGSRTTGCRFPAEHVDALDALAREEGTTRPDQLRAGVAAVLASPPGVGVVPAGRPPSGLRLVTWPPAVGQLAGLHGLAEELGVPVACVLRWAVARHIAR
jgi:hypothetical protein